MTSQISNLQKVPSKLLHEKLDKPMLLKMKKVFDQKGSMEKGAFRKLLAQVSGLKYTDDEFNVLFLKIDSSR